MSIATCIMLFSGLFGALSNFCMRKCVQNRGSARLFFLFQLFFTFLVMLVMHPVRFNSYSINLYTVAIGLACGLSLAIVKFIISYAVTRGPSSLTFASVNSASVIPCALSSIFFANMTDYSYTPWHILGSILVVVGLFWAINDQLRFALKRRWIVLAVAALLMNALFLFLSQSHVMIVSHEQILAPIWRLGSETIHSEWFAPLIFATAFFVHLWRFLVKESRLPTNEEYVWGVIGGLFNGICSYLFIVAIGSASGNDRIFLFPIFSISLIIACNIWGQWLYKEHVHWKANCVCLSGIFLGTLAA